MGLSQPQHRERMSMKPTIEIEVQGRNKSYPLGITSAEILQENPVKDGRDVVAAIVNGNAVDLSTPLTESARLEFVPANSPLGLEILRHSTAHVMAQAVKELFPDVQITIGPAIADGFYYDFDTSRPFTPGDLEKIEGRMAEIVKGRLPFHRAEMSRGEAIRLFHDKGENYKVELINGIDAAEVSVYSQGDFTDLCR
ncbi:MAG: threonine--tRNA ligase, partial [Deltaproteobacteria bacterium]|nr:threonine--tRNA ligase [Deltaproteobacteria bacterium]